MAIHFGHFGKTKKNPEKKLKITYDAVISLLLLLSV